MEHHHARGRISLSLLVGPQQIDIICLVSIMTRLGLLVLSMLIGR